MQQMQAELTEARERESSLRTQLEGQVAAATSELQSQVDKLRTSEGTLKDNQRQLRSALQQKLDEHAQLIEVISDLTTQVGGCDELGCVPPCACRGVGEQELGSMRS